MRFTRLALLLGTLLAFPVAATGQDFGIMESAETINQGNFKLRVNPMLLFGRHGGDSDAGVAVAGGYGVTRSFDLEGAVAFYDGVTFFGANGEFWLVKHKPIDFSVAFGVHHRTGKFTDDYNGVDLTFLAGGHATPRFEPYVGVDLAFEGLGAHGDYKTAHLVPGFEYKVSETIDLLAELGVALNDNSRHYLSGGIAIYFR